MSRTFHDTDVVGFDECDHRPDVVLSAGQLGHPTSTKGVK